ncbi:MAG: c-type cytochrome [Verrucomicrobiales bacterium]
MKSLARAAALILAAASFSLAFAKERPVDWQPIQVPGVWDGQLGGAMDDFDGVAWYRCRVRPPAGWASGEVVLEVERIDNAFEVFLNGAKLGGAGKFPPSYQSGLEAPMQRLAVPADLLKAGASNAVAIRVYDHDGRGGFKGRAPTLRKGNDGIVMAGAWQIRAGDDPAQAAQAGGPEFVTVTNTSEQPHETASGALSPQESAAQIQTPGDLAADLLLHEPGVRQPLHLSFDERGRLWVVQYIQYPNPAGIKQLSRDKVWRIVYDRMPPPPPHAADSPFRGQDVISIHEDADGDGTYESRKVFAGGLNMATAVARGRGGVWVMNPPYLLFYPDADRDDVPDGPPAVHLQGFGLEDTHSIANSLRWGPDGWLYGAQGSTVSAAITRPGIDGGDADAIKTMGQNIWRYHPERRIYEVFAEGGGNAYGLEIDVKGRAYSGHNGGDTRGFHYVQGGYYQKSFGKHGDLTNPHSYGYFPQMKHHSVARFTHQFILLESPGLPDGYLGKLWGVDVLHNNLVYAEISPLGSTFQTKDLGRPMESRDPWFRPVMVADGPDGALYVADWYDRQVNHYRNHEGRIDPEMGRVYRLRAKAGWQPVKVGDLGAAGADELIAHLRNPNRWFRQTALRIIGDRRDPNMIPKLRKIIAGGEAQPSLEALWALYQCGGFDAAAQADLLDHPDPFVRAWAIRLIGDEPSPPVTPVAEKLAAMAEGEPHAEVRSQLACTARRLPPALCLAMARGLAMRDADAADPHLPLLIWWAVERQCEKDPGAAAALFDARFWKAAIARETLAPRLMRRFAATGARKDLLVCARLLEGAPGAAETAILLRGFEEAFQGRPMQNLPDELVAAIAKVGDAAPLALRLRQGDAAAAAEALRLIRNGKAADRERLALIAIVSETALPAGEGALLEIATDPATPEPVAAGALAALRAYSSEAIAASVIGAYAELDPAARGAALELVTSRPAWSVFALQAADSGKLPAADFPLALIKKIQLQPGEELAARIDKLWGKRLAAATGDKEAEIARVKAILETPETRGVPKVGEATFAARCAACHTMFGKGGKVGPDLTSYQRSDLDTMLLSIAAPSAEIREGYENTVVTAKDGAIHTGFLADQDQNVLVLRDVAGNTTAIQKTDIANTQVLPISIMPEGLLTGLDEQQLRDLFAYLRSTTPPF